MIMPAPTLTQRAPIASVILGRPQELFPNVIVLQFLGDHWNLQEFKPRISGRGKWWDGSVQHEIFCRPVTLGINERNIMTLGAAIHRRDPVIAIHIFSRDPNGVDKITEEVDRIVRAFGVNPMAGVQTILPAPIPSVIGSEEDNDEGSVLFHNVYFVKVLYHKGIT